MNLPPPKPSRKPRTYFYAAPTANVQPKPKANMNDYYAGCGGGCFGGENVVKVMTNGLMQCKKVCDLAVGDMVQVDGGLFDRIRFVVQLRRDKRRRMLLLPGGLVITGGHPIRRNGVWCLPRNECDAVEVDGVDKVYTFVLDRCDIMIVNGMECVTWAHQIKDDVVKHSFYGTNAVIGALEQKMMGQEVELLRNVIAVYSE